LKRGGTEEVEESKFTADLRGGTLIKNRLKFAVSCVPSPRGIWEIIDAGRKWLDENS